MKKHLLIAIAAFSVLSSPITFANTDLKGHVASFFEQNDPAIQEYIEVLNNMYEPMIDGVMDENPDFAFTKAMISHHNGAIKLAEVELKYGKDENIRQLAHHIIATKQKELEFMQQWLNKNEANE